MQHWGSSHLTGGSTGNVVEAPWRLFTADHAADKAPIRRQRDEGSGDTPMPGRQWHDNGQRVVALLDLFTSLLTYRATSMGRGSRWLSSACGGLLHPMGWLHLLVRGARGGPAVRSESRQRHHDISGFGAMLYGNAPAWVLMAVAQPPV